MTRAESGTALRMAPAAEARRVAEAYRACFLIATSHYENFSVGSWLLPKRLRRHIAAVYAFARVADDIADEGDRTPRERLMDLRCWEEGLESAFRGTPEHPVFVALAETAAEFNLEIEPFQRLLVAFRRDVEFRPFGTFEELMAYCRCSANPVGHLVLALFGHTDVDRRRLADQICTALQITNFLQDLSVDVPRGRLYLPLDEMEQFGCSPEDLASGVTPDGFPRLVTFQIERARQMFREGLWLADRVERRLGREVRLFAWGGLTILTRIERDGHNVLQRRPTVPVWTKAALVFRAAAGCREGGWIG